MHAQTIIFTVAGLATTVLGQGNTACLSTLGSFFTAIPLPTNSDLSKFLSSYLPSNSALLETNPCAIATAIPTSLSSAASAYQAQISSFANTQGPAISALATGCGAGPVAPSEFTGAVALVTALGGDSCFTAKAAGKTGSPGSDGSPNSSGTANAAMPKPTGVIAGAAAAAGFLGAIALL
ncbi:hypothetical protein F4779DRAFT_527146 [Xylariaceae sp. FL0662B]|nr:hypothetical protein F4779DRAFT_527146 [Xylariaceae sp. FL0662B]